MSRARQVRLPLHRPAQPNRQAWLLHSALLSLEAAYGKGHANPRIVLTADEQRAIEAALAEAARLFDIPPHRSVAAFTFTLHGVVVRMWYHEDGHLYLLSDQGHRLLAGLDLWA